MEKKLKQISKFMSLVLRHKPETIGLQLNEHGWANVQEMIDKMNTTGADVDIDLIHTIVETNDKKRFAFNEDMTMIRASQGHSVEVDLNLNEVQPPEFLYHGTIQESVDIIRLEGLKKMSRQHIHLSKDKETAIKVGSRRGKPVILVIRAAAMHADGYRFYLSENEVWLTDEVPVQYIQF
jgi:putative RNA 2'-phosphotransferase